MLHMTSTAATAAALTRCCDAHAALVGMLQAHLPAVWRRMKQPIDEAHGVHNTLRILLSRCNWRVSLAGAVCCGRLHQQHHLVRGGSLPGGPHHGRGECNHLPGQHRIGNCTFECCSAIKGCAEVAYTVRAPHSGTYCARFSFHGLYPKRGPSAMIDNNTPAQRQCRQHM